MDSGQHSNRGTRVLSGAKFRTAPAQGRRFAQPLSFLLLSLLTGCALAGDNGSPPLVKACVLPTDQSGTIAGHWRVTPIPIAFHQGDFSTDEISAMTAGADTWNTFYSATQGLNVIDYGGANVRFSSQPVPTNVCGQGLLQGNSFSGQVVIYRQNKWPHSGAGTTIALTSFCTSPAKPYPSTYMAYMEVNYQGFFQQGLKQPDLQTIVSHELGHLLGLYHSCDAGSTAAGKPDCLNSSLNPDYQTALMYPVFGFNSDLSGEQKRNLASNDQGRANCLYQKTSTGGSN
jgi:hypothetical protein